MKKYLIWLLLISSVCNAQEVGSDEIAGWLKEEIKAITGQHAKVEISGPIKKCATNASEPKDTGLFVFISFSMPDEALLDLARDLGKAGGILVIRGIPDNSFRALASRLLVLKEQGLKTAIQINPKLFEEYDVTTVPTFVRIGDQSWDKVSGHISLSYALELFGDD